MSLHLSERQFFGLSLSGLLLLAGLLYAVLLRPGFQQRTQLRNEIAQQTQQLMQMGFLMGEAPLLERRALLDRELRLRMGEWDAIRERLGTFPDQERLGTLEVGRIDYQFHLYATRARLLRKAQAQNIEIPLLLGLPDFIDSDTVARELYMQLQAVESLVDTAIEYEIANIRSIDPLPPVRHESGSPATVFLEEFPLRVTFEGDMHRLYRLWEAMFQTHRAMMLRNIAMEKTSLNQPNAVRMTATLSALLFIGDAANLPTLAEDPNVRLRPRGF